jgi:hypothetical protein
MGCRPVAVVIMHVHKYEIRIKEPGGLHEKHGVATWILGNHLSTCFYTWGNQEKPVPRWLAAGPFGY